MASKSTSYQPALWPQLPILSQEEVVKSLTPYYPFLWETVNEPWEDVRERRETDPYFNHMTEDELGCWLTMQAAHRARALFDGKDQFRTLDSHGKVVIVFDERLAITIKKLTPRLDVKTGKRVLMRSNYRTVANLDYWDQRRNGIVADMPRIILGYELIKEVTDIRIMLAYPRSRGHGVEWAERIPEQSRRTIPLARPTILPAATTGGDERGFRITARADTERAGERKGGDAG